jgi:hypothetical protein
MRKENAMPPSQHWKDREWTQPEKSAAYRRPSQEVRLERIAEAKQRQGKFRIEEGIRQEYVDGVWIDRPWGDPDEMPNRVKEAKTRKARVKAASHNRRKKNRTPPNGSQTRQRADRTQGHKGYE